MPFYDGVNYLIDVCCLLLLFVFFGCVLFFLVLPADLRRVVPLQIRFRQDFNIGSRGNYRITSTIEIPAGMSRVFKRSRECPILFSENNPLKIGLQATGFFFGFFLRNLVLTEDILLA